MRRSAVDRSPCALSAPAVPETGSRAAAVPSGESDVVVASAGGGPRIASQNGRRNSSGLASVVSVMAQASEQRTSDASCRNLAAAAAEGRQGPIDGISPPTTREHGQGL
jgi:hypothetical protein